MLLRVEDWMDVRACRAMRNAGATWVEIARETGHDWRTVKKYLADDAGAAPPRPQARPPQPKLIDAWAPVIDAMLRRAPRLRATVIHQRLVAEHGFPGTYQRVKLYVAEARERIAPAPVELHRRFEVLPGAQAQVDWGDEGTLDEPTGGGRVWSFHMVLSYSRDPFGCFVHGQDLGTFWDCHRRAFAHFGGVPAAIVFDRTKTVVRQHVGRGVETPLHPEARAFAEHYGFAIVLAAPRRPQTKGRVERQVDIVRAGVLEGRTFDTVEAMDAAFAGWLPGRRASVHRTHGEVIALRAEADRAALGPVPERPYVVTERHLRRVGKDCLVSFEASVYSLPWRTVPRSRRVELRVSRAEVAIWSLGPRPERLATHRRARAKGTWAVDAAHWDGLPAGERALTPCALDAAEVTEGSPVAVLSPELARIPKVTTPVARRPLEAYDQAAGL